MYLPSTLAILVYTLSIVFIFTAPNEDKVNLTLLPPQFKIDYNFPIYSGYLPINQAKLHYVYLPSQSNPSKDKLVLWLNGGPGCSSLLGLFYENGPFFFKDWSEEIEYNPYSWNKNVNMLYIESPSGVGFSIGNSINHNDDEVASQNLSGLIVFFQKFPELRLNEFYISGESYAGIYIPTLSNKILSYNQKATKQMRINLKGFLIGNGVTHPKYDLASAALDFQFGHALFTVEMRRRVTASCGEEAPYNVNDPNCKELIDEIKTINKDINIYDIYRNCYPPSGIELTEEKVNINRKYSHLYNPFNLISKTLRQDVKFEPPCSDSYGIHMFFNNKDVQKVFNVMNIPFEMCSDDVYYSYIMNDLFSFYLYPMLIKSKLRILIYSGDTDMVVPLTGTIKWIQQLNLKVISPYRPWSIRGSKEVAGFVTVYDGLTFATIKGTGHMVPQWKRKEAFDFFDKFINDEEL